MDAIDKLIDHWRALDLSASPYIHPADRSALIGANEFEFGAIPYPYVGDIRQADIWILMLNSGLGPDDAKQEAEQYFAERLRSNLVQNLDGYEYGMLSLDPKLHGTGTYTYYNQRNGLAKLIGALAKTRLSSERKARVELASRLAVIQLCPYRSRSGVPSRFISDAVPSVRLARNAVKEAVKTKLVVVPRSAAQWGLEYGLRTENLFTFRANQARSASLTPAGACGGGDVILSHICTN